MHLVCNRRKYSRKCNVYVSRKCNVYVSRKCNAYVAKVRFGRAVRCCSAPFSPRASTSCQWLRPRGTTTQLVKLRLPPIGNPTTAVPCHDGRLVLRVRPPRSSPCVLKRIMVPVVYTASMLPISSFHALDVQTATALWKQRQESA